MVKIVVFILLIIMPWGKLWSQNAACVDALPFCGSNIYTFPASVCNKPPPPGGGTACPAESGPCYDCLITTPNPVWYFMQIGDPGNIIISISNSANKDIDFVCWGPLTSPTGECMSGLTCSKVVSCSYSPNAVPEICTIPNALSGQFYMLMITNYANFPTNITFFQSNFGQPGAGNTNCNIVINCSILSFSLFNVI